MIWPWENCGAARPVIPEQAATPETEALRAAFIKAKKEKKVSAMAEMSRAIRTVIEDARRPARPRP